MSPHPLDVLAGRARWSLVRGDSRLVLPRLPDKSVHHVITDPPYEAQAHTSLRRVLTSSRRGDANRKVGWDPNDQWTVSTLSFAPITDADRQSISLEVARLTKRWALAFCQTEASQRWRAAFEAGGMTYRRTAIWVKPDGQPQLSGDRPGCGYESICVMHAADKSRWNGGGKLGVFTHAKGGTTAKHAHPTQKPLPLMLELVRLFTDPDDIVLDPFAGSATTGVACFELGRRFIGIERDARFYRAALRRLRRASGHPDTRGRAA